MFSYLFFTAAQSVFDMIFNDERIKHYFIIFSIGVVVQPIEAIDFKEETFIFFTDYKITTNDSILLNEMRSAQACGSVCLTTSDCCAVSYISNTRECYLDTSGSSSSQKVPYVGSMVMIRHMYAVPDGNDPVLPTVGGTVPGGNNTVLPTDCEDASGGNGIYTIYPSTGNDFNVYCELGSDNQYWTVIQRRVNGQTNFYETWQTYKMGFGNLADEFWLGNEYIHMLTSNNDYTLRIELENFSNEMRYAEYDSFQILDELSNYQLSVEGYSGNAGDSLDFHNGMPFSTKDRDNDPSPNDCAVVYLGAWWYNNCHHSNLNGKYLSGSHISLADGIEWFTWTGHHYSLKSSKMMIRRETIVSIEKDTASCNLKKSNKRSMTVEYDVQKGNMIFVKYQVRQSRPMNFFWRYQNLQIVDKLFLTLCIVMHLTILR